MDISHMQHERRTEKVMTEFRVMTVKIGCAYSAVKSETKLKFDSFPYLNIWTILWKCELI